VLESLTNQSEASEVTRWGEHKIFSLGRDRLKEWETEVKKKKKLGPKREAV
jgi:hypothetical protein